MRCEDISAQFVDYLAGSLSETGRHALESHVQHCAACQKELTEAAQVWQLLGQIPADVPDSRAMRARFDAALAEAASHDARRNAAQNVTEAAITTHTAAVNATRGAAADDTPTDAPDRTHTAAPHRTPTAARSATLASRGRISAWMRRHAAIQPLLQGCAALLVLLVGIQIGRGVKPPPSADVRQLSQEVRDLRQMVTLSLLQQQSASERLTGVSWSNRLDRPGEEVVSALIDTLMHDPNVNVRLASIDALKRFSERDEVKRAAVHALDTQSSPLVQMALIDFVVETQDRDALGALRKLSSDTHVNDSVRARAAWGIHHLGAA
jgi:hypothetical protein